MVKEKHVVVATDSNYLIHTGVLLKSIADFNDGVTIHVLGNRLTDADKSKLEKISDKIKVRFYSIGDEEVRKRLFNSKSITSDRSLATYSRLLIPELLPEEIDRCIYMDVDAIVLGNLDDLMETDLENYALAGVLDSSSNKLHEAVGLTRNQTYINAGFILWNLDYCRKNNIVDKFADFIERRNGSVRGNDQGTINGVLSDKIKTIHPRYNLMTPFFDMKAAEIKSIYGTRVNSDEEYQEAVASPVFVHFTPFMTTRPWVENSRHPLRDSYWHYRLQLNPEKNLQKDKRIPRLRFLSWAYYNCRPLFIATMKAIEAIK